MLRRSSSSTLVFFRPLFSQGGSSKKSHFSSFYTCSSGILLRSAMARAAKRQKTTTTSGCEDGDDSSVTILSWNVNGIRAALKKSEGKFERIIAEENPDVICLQETKIDESLVGQFADLLPGYKQHWSCCTTKKGYSGTALFSKTEPLDVSFAFEGAKQSQKEGRIITAEYPWGFLVNTYVPNSGLKLDRLDYRTSTWDKQLREHLRALEEKRPNCRVVWTGDLNVAHRDQDVMDPKKKRNKVPGFCDAERENFGEIVGGDGPISDEDRAKRTNLIGRPGSSDTSIGFSDAWLQAGHGDEEGYTFWSYRFKAFEKNNGWRLDYFVLSKAMQKCLKGVTRRKDAFGISDHIPIISKYSVP